MWQARLDAVGIADAMLLPNISSSFLQAHMLLDTNSLAKNKGE